RIPMKVILFKSCFRDIFIKNKASPKEKPVNSIIILDFGWVANVIFHCNLAYLSPAIYIYILNLHDIMNSKYKIVCLNTLAYDIFNKLTIPHIIKVMSILLYNTFIFVNITITLT